MKQLTCTELADQLRSSAPVVLLDVREPFERELAHIPAGPGTTDLFIPMRVITSRIDEIRKTTTAAQAPLVVYCHHGVRSLMVAQWIAAQGIEAVFNLDGGIDAYSLEADPTVPRY